MSDVSPARIAAHRVLRRVLEQGAYADRALRTELRGLDDPRDRALAKRLVFGTVQRRGTLDWVIATRAKGNLEPPVRTALQLGLYELLFSDAAGEHAVVSAAVELAKPSPGHALVNAVLRRVQREGVELPEDTTPAGAAVAHSHPEWLARAWFKMLGGPDARALMAADNEPAELALRINPLVELDEEGLPPGRRDGEAYVVDGRFDVAGSPLFAAGAITPQSRAAQSVARLLDPQPGETVLDLCAAPGGKTTHLAALMADRGSIVAVERHAGRCEELRATAARMRVSIVEVVKADGRTFDTGVRFDRVLLDPPCSGLGTLRSHPDLRWRMSPEAIEGLVQEQDALVANARRLLKPGGTLVYSTCTISSAEERVRGTTCHQTLPHRDGTDGFYTARQ